MLETCRSKRVSLKLCDNQLAPGQGVQPMVGYTGRGAFFKLAVFQREGKIAILVYDRVTKISCKVGKMVAKAKYI